MNITPEQFKRIDNDVNGNPRYVIHYNYLLSDKEDELYPLTFSPIFKVVENMKTRYKLALSKAKKVGGKKYNTKSFGGGIVFQSYNLNNLCNELNSL